MKTKVFIFAGFLIFLISFSSCTEDCPPIDSPIEEMHPCEMNIDKSLTFDTLWNIENENIYSIDYSDKYFGIRINKEDKYEIRSVETGDLITAPDFKKIDKSFISHLQIVGDYVIANGSELNPVVYKYNILTDKLKVSDTIDYGVGYVFKEDYFYYSTKSEILKMDYDGKAVDTIYKYKNKISLFDLNKLAVVGDELIAVYHDQDTEILTFRIIDTKSKEIKENLVYSAGFSVPDFTIIDSMVNISGYDFKFSYNLTNQHHFVIIGGSAGSSGFNNNLFSISKAATYENKSIPMVFFNTSDYFNAYNFNTVNLIWKCRKQYSDVFPVYLHNNEGKESGYLAAFSNDGLYLMEPYTGIVKSYLKYNYRHKSSSNSKVYDDKIIIKSDSGLTKIKVK